MATTFTTNYGFDKPAISDLNWGGIRNTNMDDVDAELFKPRIGQNAPTVGATTTLDLSLARVFVFTVTQITTIAFSNVPSTFPNGAVVPAVRILLKVTNGAAFAVTWPASIIWPNGDTDPLLTASGVDWIELHTVDGGTTWYGSVFHQKETGKLRCRAYRNATQSITSAVETAVSYDTEDFDVGGMHDPAVNPTRFTIPVVGAGGCYVIHAHAVFAANATGIREIRIKKNGATDVAIHLNSVASAADGHYISVTAFINAPVATDYFEARVRQVSGGNLNVGGGGTPAATDYFEIVQIR